MTDEQDGRPMGGSAVPVTGQQVPPTVARPTPGWYPDPWMSGHHRYWNGVAWTGDSFPDGPAAPATPAAPAAADTPAPSGGSGPWVAGTSAPAASSIPEPPLATPPPPPAWSPPKAEAPAEWAGPPPPPPRSSGISTGRFVGILLLVAVLIGSASFAGVYFSLHKDSKTPTALAPLPTSPSSPSTPSTTIPASNPILSRIIVTQNDVGSTMSVQLVNSKGVGLGDVTLNVCNANYPSESLRTDRIQVVALDGQGASVLQTEAVLYSTPAATAQAFSELTAAQANCPSTPVPSPTAGQPTVTTKYNPAPDGAWPQVPSVQRLAFDIVTADDTGQSQHSIVTYLRRGKVLLGLYFDNPDTPQPSVAGQTTIPGIVNVFANRIAQLPASAIGA